MRKYLLAMGILLLCLLFKIIYEGNELYNPNKILNKSKTFNKNKIIYSNSNLINKNKKLNKEIVSYNSSKFKENDTLNRIVDNDEINKFNIILKRFNKQYSNNKKFNQYFKDINLDIQLKNKWNYYSYIDYTNIYDDFKIISHKNNLFSNLFNDILSKLNDEIKEFKTLNIYKYKIIHKKNINNLKYFNIILTLYFKKIYNLYYHCKFEIFVKDNKYIYKKVKLVSTSIFDIEMKGYSNNRNLMNNYFDIHRPINNHINYNTSTKILNKKLQQIEDNISFKYDMKCFNIHNNNLLSTINCEKRDKNGILDRPCTSNDECIYYKKNKNYNNSFGKCINNFCELPVGSKQLGYHFELKNSKPLCYNCIDNNNEPEWRAITKVDYCCDEQDKNNNNYNSKYDFLKSPDYYFKGDEANRINYEMKDKYNKGEIFYSKKFNDDWYLDNKNI